MKLTDMKPSTLVRKLRVAQSNLAFYVREYECLRERATRLEARLNAPEIKDFASAVMLEAAHQRERWSAQRDAGKSAADWFWLIGYLAGKALHAVAEGREDKALHHVITTAAACANWHAALSGSNQEMRPGIAEPSGSGA